jgi:hypothetical protein
MRYLQWAGHPPLFCLGACASNVGVNKRSSFDVYACDDQAIPRNDSAHEIGDTLNGYTQVGLIA